MQGLFSSNCAGATGVSARSRGTLRAWKISDWVAALAPRASRCTSSRNIAQAPTGRVGVAGVPAQELTRHCPSQQVLDLSRCAVVMDASELARRCPSLQLLLLTGRAAVTDLSA